MATDSRWIAARYHGTPAPRTAVHPLRRRRPCYTSWAGHRLQFDLASA